LTNRYLSETRLRILFTKEQSGWLMSAFFFSYAIFSIPAAQFGQRIGSRRALPFFAIVWSAAMPVNVYDVTAPTGTPSTSTLATE